MLKDPQFSVFLLKAAQKWERDRDTAAFIAAMAPEFEHRPEAAQLGLRHEHPWMTVQRYYRGPGGAGAPDNRPYGLPTPEQVAYYRGIESA